MSALTAPVSSTNGRLSRPATTDHSPSQRILAVEFVSVDGRTWHAIGGGENVAAAITYARESCPDDAAWRLRSWCDLYGD